MCIQERLIKSVWFCVVCVICGLFRARQTETVPQKKRDKTAAFELLEKEDDYEEETRKL